MSLSVDGFWKAGFWSQTFWADGFWREGTPEPTPEVVTQGGHWWIESPPEVEHWRDRSAKQRREFLERIILGIQEAPEEIKEQAVEVLAPYAPGKGKAKQLQVPSTEYKRLANNLAAVKKLAALYQQAIEEDEDSFILMAWT